MTVTEAPPLSAGFESFDGTDAFDSPSGTEMLTCSECGVEFPYGGRGRRSTKCPQHRKQQSRSSSGGSKSRAQRPSITLLAEAVTMNLRTIGSIVSMANTYDGQVIMAGAPMFGTACGNVADHDARFRRWLESSATSIVYGELIAAAMVIAVPILANHGLLPKKAMDNIASMYFGANGEANAVPNG